MARSSRRPPSPPASPPAPDPRPPKGRRFPAEVRRQALALILAGMMRVQVARKFGTTTESLRRWVQEARAKGSFPPPDLAVVLPAPQQAAPAADPAPAEPQASRAPHDPGFGLGAHEVAAILELKRRHPSMGPAQLRAQLKRFKGWRLSVKAIARVLRKHGFELEHRGSRPKDEPEVRRFEAPHRNALWQLDFTELHIGPERRSLLLIEDDFSRFLVAHQLLEHPTSEAVVELLRRAIAHHGLPEAVYTDRGGQFLAWMETSSFQRFLEEQLIDHHVTPSYAPRGRGKIEAAIHTVQRELWEVRHFGSVDEAERALDSFVREYNYRRAHLGIDGLVPADRFFGRWEEVKAAIDAESRRRAGAHALRDQSPITEELLPDDRVELLRLMVCGGELELRFLGHRVRLGRVEP